MTIPSKQDLDNLQKKIDGFLKKLNEDGSPKRPIDGVLNRVEVV